MQAGAWVFRRVRTRGWVGGVARGAAVWGVQGGGCVWGGCVWGGGVGGVAGVGMEVVGVGRVEDEITRRGAGSVGRDVGWQGWGWTACGTGEGSSAR